MNNLAKGMLSFGISQIRDMQKSNEKWKEQLRQEWRDSMKLPRKKKKQRRKEIMLDWQIANWDCGFGFNLDDLDMMESVIKKL